MHPSVKKKTLHDFIARTVKDEAEAIYTDELKSYLGIADHDTRHETVNHSIEEWVVGDVHTNGIRRRLESFQALYRRHLPQDESQAYGSLSRRTGMAVLTIGTIRISSTILWRAS